MPRPKQDKFCVHCEGLIVNPENIKKKGYACDTCKQEGHVYFCGKCGYQKTPIGVSAVNARCSRCRPPIHTLEYRDGGAEDFSSPDLREVFITAFTDTYSPFTHGEADLGQFLLRTYEETKQEVLSDHAISIVALAPTSTVNKYVGVITAKLDKANKAVYISQAAVIKRCWGLGVLKSLSTNLLATLGKRLEFERLYFITRLFNEKVAKIAMERFFFVQTSDESLFPPNYDRSKYVSFVCQGDDLTRLRDKLRIKAEKQKKRLGGGGIPIRPKKKRSIPSEEDTSSMSSWGGQNKRSRYSVEDEDFDQEDLDQEQADPDQEWGELPEQERPFCEFDFGRDSDSESGPSSPVLSPPSDMRSQPRPRKSSGGSPSTSSSAPSPAWSHKTVKPEDFHYHPQSHITPLTAPVPVFAPAVDLFEPSYDQHHHHHLPHPVYHPEPMLPPTNISYLPYAHAYRRLPPQQAIPAIAPTAAPARTSFQTGVPPHNLFHATQPLLQPLTHHLQPHILHQPPRFVESGFLPVQPIDLLNGGHHHPEHPANPPYEYEEIHEYSGYPPVSAEEPDWSGRAQADSSSASY